MTKSLLEREVLAQWRKLQKDCDIRRTMNRQNLILWARSGVISSPQGGGGWGMKKRFSPETAAEIFAAVNVLEALGMTLAQIRTVRELALLLENAPVLTPENAGAEVERLSNAFDKKNLFLAGVIGWLRSKNLAMRYLYDVELSDRQKFFETKGFELFLFGLVFGFYRGYGLDGKGGVIKPADAPEPKDAFEKFVTASAEPTTLAAKPRE